MRYLALALLFILTQISTINRRKPSLSEVHHQLLMVRLSKIHLQSLVESRSEVHLQLLKGSPSEVRHKLLIASLSRVYQKQVLDQQTSTKRRRQHVPYLIVTVHSRKIFRLQGLEFRRLLSDQDKKVPILVDGIRLGLAGFKSGRWYRRGHAGLNSSRCYRLGQAGFNSSRCYRLGQAGPKIRQSVRSDCYATEVLNLSLPGC